MMMMMAKAI